MKTIQMLLVFLFTGSILFSQPANFYSRGIGGGGALFFPTINPANDNEFYVSCDMSEMFHTNDFGNSYDQIPFSKLQVSGLSSYEFTGTPGTAYCIANDGNNSFPVKTTDGGNSWPTTSYDLNTYGSAYKISVNYDNSQLLVGAYGDILFSNNGGTSFSLVAHAQNMGAGIIMGGVFWDNNDIYIGTNEGIFHSSNSGSSFSIMPVSGMASGEVIWSFAGARTGNDIRFVCIAANSSDVYNGVNPWEYYNFPKQVYVMDNANGTWMASSTGINFANDFLMYAGLAKNDISTIYLGGNDQSAGGPLVMKSSNGGQSWTKKFNTVNNANIITAWEGYQGDKNWGWSENCFGITVAPNNSSKVIFSTFSNVQVSSNGGDDWKQAYVSSADQHPAGAPTPQKQRYHSIGLENTTCWQVHWQNADTMIGCFSDIGCIRSDDSGESWGFTYNGFSVNSLYRVEKIPNGKLYGACSNIHDMYQSTRLTDALLDANDANGKIVYSTDNGSNWANLHTFNHPVFWLASDPNNADVMYASVIHTGTSPAVRQGGIYRTADLNSGSASVWTKLPDPPRTEGHPACIRVLNDGKVVCTFSGRRNSGGTFTASSGVFIYDPDLLTWTDVSDPGMYYWTKDIIIDPADSTQSTWYVCVFSGWGGPPNGLGGLYKTTNRGLNWTRITGTQFQSVTSITFNPQNNYEAYLTTEMQGLWYSQNMNSSNPVWNLVTAYPFRQPERVFFNPFNNNEMWVSSFGNGMKKGTLLPSSVADISSPEKNCQVYPSVTDREFYFDCQNYSNRKITVYNISGQAVYVSGIDKSKTSVNVAEWPAGMYFIRCGNENFRIIKP